MGHFDSWGCGAKTIFWHPVTSKNSGQNIHGISNNIKHVFINKI